LFGNQTKAIIECRSVKSRGKCLSPTMRRLKAKYEGVCQSCDKPIQPGMDILWEKGVGAFHIDCWNASAANKGNSTTYSTDYEVDAQEPEIVIPRFLQAREKRSGFQVCFYESLAVPKELMDATIAEELSKGELTGYAQWRIDFPIDTNSVVDDGRRQILNVAHKILTRGRVTLLSPFLEDRLREYFSINEFSATQFQCQKYLCLCNLSRETDCWVDSPIEKTFLEEILYSELGPYYRNCVITQVHISSLMGELPEQSTYTNQRVDFLITTRNKKIVVELDGQDHVGHEERDATRDSTLSRYGFEVIRILNQEVEDGDGLNLQDLRELLREDRIDEIGELSVVDKFIVAVKLAHQLQITTIEALLSGALNFEKCNTVYIEPDSVGLPVEDVYHILKESIADLGNLIKRLAVLYKYDLCSEKPLTTATSLDSREAQGILISYGENDHTMLPCFYVQDISFPAPIAQFGRPISPVHIENTSEEDMEFFLNYIFRKKHFWEGQYETIVRALAGKDAIVLLPTGAGKSISFQLASMLLPGVTLVIDPIISLIDDQIDNLQKAGIDRAIGITAQIRNPTTRSRVISAFGQGEFLFCYVAPERFQSEEFRGSLRSLTLSTPLCQNK